MTLKSEFGQSQKLTIVQIQQDIAKGTYQTENKRKIFVTIIEKEPQICVSKIKRHSRYRNE